MKKLLKKTNHRDIIELNGFKALAGQHCESSAIMNALNYQGVKLTESTINGFSASASFGFSREDKFPMLLLRVGDFKERFSETTGMIIQVQEPKTRKEAYDSVKNILKKGIPVILRVNMRYLPYLHNGKYGDKHTSFGWHFITLAKMDEIQGYAWVSDTSCTGLQKIRLSDLAKARNSKHGYLKADNYFYYFEDPQQSTINYKKAFKKSIEMLLGNYEEKNGILEETKKFPNDIEKIEEKRSVYMMSPLFYTMYGFIEVFGTGGSGFRNFLKEYLLEMSELLRYNKIQDIVDTVDKGCIQWKALASKFESISESVMIMKKNKNARYIMYKEASDIASKVYQTEKEIYSALKAFYDRMDIEMQ